MMKRATLGGFLVVATLSACSSGGSGTNGAAGAGSAGSSGGAGAAGTSGSAGSAGASAGASGSAGASAGHGDGGLPPSDGAANDGAGHAGSGGSGGTAGTGGSGGARSCAGRAISLSANGSGADSDAARARVVMDLMDEMPIGNADRTIEFWMYARPTDWVAERNEIYVYGNNGTTKAFGLDFGAPFVKNMPANHASLGPYTNGIYDDDTGVYLGITSAASQWIHVAMTWDRKALRTYVNGTLRITTMSGGATPTPLMTLMTPLTMGCNPPYFSCFGGLFDEVRVWNLARTDAEILGAFDKALVGNEVGLVGYWKFDEAPGATTVADAVTTVGHTAHPGLLMSATDAGAPTFVVPDPLPPVTCP
jgi:hypothetical protein